MCALYPLQVRVFGIAIFGKDPFKVKGEKLLTFGVFGVMPSYLACVEHIRHVFRQNKSFDENYIFSVENSEF